MCNHCKHMHSGDCVTRTASLSVYLQQQHLSGAHLLHASLAILRSLFIYAARRAAAPLFNNKHTTHGNCTYRPSVGRRGRDARAALLEWVKSVWGTNWKVYARNAMPKAACNFIYIRVAWGNRFAYIFAIRWHWKLKHNKLVRASLHGWW